MKDSLILQDKIYISAKRVHELFGYTSDYVGQLCRAGKLDSKMIGRAWFVTEKSVNDHQSLMSEVSKSKVKNKKKIVRRNDHANDSVDVDNKNISTDLFIPEIPVYLETISSNTFVSEIPVEIEKEKVFESPIEPAPLVSALSETIVKPSPKIEIKKFVLSPYLKLSISAFAFLLTLVIFFTSSFGNVDIMKNSQGASVASIGGKIVEVFRSVGNFASNSLNHLIGRSGEEVAISTPDVPYNGFAVVPSTKDSVKDEIIKNKIRQSFSDEVVVKPDGTKTAGVITPVFRKANGDDFLYVLVPVNNQNP